MKSLLEALEKNVDAEIEAQKGIQGRLDQQLDILLRGRTAQLASALARAEEGLERSRQLEAERTQLLARLGAKLGVPTKEVSLRLLEERIGADAGSLAGKGAELKALIERIRQRNREVGLLLRNSVLFLDDLLRAITGGAAGPATYTRSGAMQPPAAGTLAAEA
jgi:flagellar biosynthesis/type III secretory pathway chaperone